MRYSWGEYPGYFGDPPDFVLSDTEHTRILKDGTLEVLGPEGDEVRVQYRVSPAGECQSRTALSSASPGEWEPVDPADLIGTPAAYCAWRSAQIEIERRFGCADLRKETLGFDPRHYHDVVVFVHSAMCQALFDARDRDRNPLWDDALACCRVTGDARHIVQILETQGFRVSVQATAW